MDAAIDWIERHRRVWTERFDQLVRHLRTIRPSDQETPL